VPPHPGAQRGAFSGLGTLRPRVLELRLQEAGEYLDASVGHGQGAPVLANEGVHGLFEISAAVLGEHALDDALLSGRIKVRPEDLGNELVGDDEDAYQGR